MIQLEWSHPRRGSIVEYVCEHHERQVLAALRMLGIGCGGSPARGRVTCKRCEMTDVPPRCWIGRLAEATA